MKIAVITPIPLLHHYATVSDYHLVLAHLVLESFEYSDFYRHRSLQGDYVILDNSAHEFGYGATVNKLIQAASLIQPSEIVLPDRLFFGDDTLEDSLNVGKTLRKVVDCKLMGAPQGRTIEEWDTCCRGLLADSDLHIDSIGISKDYETWPSGLVGRVYSVYRIADQLQIECPEIHLLGWGRDLKALRILSKISNSIIKIRGIDSAKPLVYASAGLRLPYYLVNAPAYPRRKQNFFDLEELDIDDDYARHNINVFKSAADDETRILSGLQPLQSS